MAASGRAVPLREPAQGCLSPPWPLRASPGSSLSRDWLQPRTVKTESEPSHPLCHCRLCQVRPLSRLSPTPPAALSTEGCPRAASTALASRSERTPEPRVPIWLTLDGPVGWPHGTPCTLSLAFSGPRGQAQGLGGQGAGGGQAQTPVGGSVQPPAQGSGDSGSCCRDPPAPLPLRQGHPLRREPSSPRPGCPGASRSAPRFSGNLLRPVPGTGSRFSKN